MRIKALLLILLFPFFSVSQPEFQKYFKDRSFRIDFLLGGNSSEAIVYPQQMKLEPHWGGSKKNLIDTFNFGTYRFRVIDIETNKLIFSKGFSTLFQEWQTTAEAKKINKTFYQAAIFPSPVKKFRLEIDARQWEGNFKTIYTTEINPNNYFILDEKPSQFEIKEILKNGNPSEKVDIVILAEGYTKVEMNKFLNDAKRVTDYLFSEEPFISEKQNFNVSAILTPSVESGTDIPGENIYRNTFFNSTFYTFDIDRYLTTSDMKTIYDVAALVPYDQIFILVNSEKYGGGGFYNFISVCTSDNQLTKEVFIHEFGHGFAGLGDEYYTSSVAYENYYNLDVEPWEPNLTTLTDFDLKWEKMVNGSVEIPTPRIERNKNNVGAFEGGGYTEKGIFSPYMDCRMKSNVAGEFCPVCQDAIKKMIDFYTK